MEKILQAVAVIGGTVAGIGMITNISQMVAIGIVVPIGISMIWEMVNGI